jgi:hypothetical protein
MPPPAHNGANAWMHPVGRRSRRDFWNRLRALMDPTTLCSDGPQSAPLGSVYPALGERPWQAKRSRGAEPAYRPPTQPQRIDDTVRATSRGKGLGRVSVVG